jgi:hypothetical protein
MVEDSDITRVIGLRLLSVPDQPSGGLGEPGRCCAECRLEGLLGGLGGDCRVVVVGWAGNRKSESRAFGFELRRMTDGPPSCGVVSAETVPGRRRLGRIGAGSSASAGGVVDSYSGEGCLDTPRPRPPGPCNGADLGVICRLALLL